MPKILRGVISRSCHECREPTAPDRRIIQGLQKMENYDLRGLPHHAKETSEMSDARHSWQIVRKNAVSDLFVPAFLTLKRRLQRL